MRRPKFLLSVKRPTARFSRKSIRGRLTFRLETLENQSVLQKTNQEENPSFQMEDSGIDSEDKQSSIPNEKVTEKSQESDDGDDESSNNLEVMFKGPTEVVNSQPTSANGNSQLSSCRILQRKLELKVERAKRNYNQFYEENVKKSKSSTLIPINRLQIPGYSENQPLVEYKSDSDDPEEISFFPVKSKQGKKQDLTDTFSMQEMTIDSDNSDDSGSQSLELLPPPPSNSKIVDKLLNCFYCSVNGS